MKVIIPLAGKGTRLRPHTHVTPKPMLRVAGKPVMAYILDDLKALGGVEQIVYITGHLKEKVEEFAKRNYDFPSVFVEQVVQNGTASAVQLARPYVDQPVLIIFVDTIFETDLSVINLTDAFQYMIDKDATINVLDVAGWYDAGKLDTLLETNRVMLEKGRAKRPRSTDGSTIIEPVYIEEGVVLKGSSIGPNVSIGAGTVVEGSEIRDALIGAKSRIVRSSLRHSMVGDEAVLEGGCGEVTVGDHSEVHMLGSG